MKIMTNETATTTTNDGDNTMSNPVPNFTTLMLGALIRLSESSKPNTKRLANVVMNLDSDAPIIQKIDMIHTKYANAKQYAQTMEAVTGEKYDGAPVAPEFFLTFVQQLMNTCCGVAKRLHEAQYAKQDDDAANFFHGYDAAADIAEEAEMPIIDKSHLPDILLADRDQCQALQTRLLSKMSYLTEQNPIALYQNTAKNEETGQYEVVSYCNNVNDIYAHLNEVRLKMQELNEQADATASASLGQFAVNRQAMVSTPASH
jgi:hypothetical protein